MNDPRRLSVDDLLKAARQHLWAIPPCDIGWCEDQLKPKFQHSLVAWQRLLTTSPSTTLKELVAPSINALNQVIAEEFYRQCHSLAVAAIRRFPPSYNLDVADIVSEAIVALLNKSNDDPAAFPDVDCVNRYLFTVCHNRACRVAKAEQRHLAERLSADYPDRFFSSHSTVDGLARTLALLREKCTRTERQVLDLLERGYSQGEIAQTLGHQVGYVYTLCFRIRSKVAELFSPSD
jgi:RNA polymerase sigma factor (sigma-70 family)